MTNGSKISVHEANECIDNYLETYYNAGSFPVKSFIYDAALLRDYLNENPHIENMKFMLGQRSDGPTLVIVGYDSNGNYVKTDGDMVLDHAAPCPNCCPSHGEAQNDRIS